MVCKAVAVWGYVLRNRNQGLKANRPGCLGGVASQLVTCGPVRSLLPPQVLGESDERCLLRGLPVATRMSFRSFRFEEISCRQSINASSNRAYLAYLSMGGRRGS